jgi:putative transposase
MAKFLNKYRVESSRASWWNYGWFGAYFLTICTKNREHFFGKIQNNKMIKFYIKLNSQIKN